MAGFANDSAGREVMFCDNVDFTGNVAVPTAQMLSNGQLIIGSAVAPNLRINTLTPGTNISIVNGNGTITPAVVNNPTFSGLTTLFGGAAFKYVATNVSYSVQPTDVIIGVTSTAAARTITMPLGPATGQWWIIKDESGGASTHNITVSGNGNNIDGAATQTIASNFGSFTIYWSGSAYFIV